MEWHFKDVEITRFLKEINEGIVNKEFGYIGEARCGDLCFDFTAREDNILYADLYVGGINSGYGYGKDDYPYEHVDNINCLWSINMFLGMDIELFKRFFSEKLSEIIKNSKQIQFEDSSYSLIEKASCELGDW